MIVTVDSSFLPGPVTVYDNETVGSEAGSGTFAKLFEPSVHVTQSGVELANVGTTTGRYLPLAFILLVLVVVILWKWSNR